jgi:O-antigen ligase
MEFNEFRIAVLAFLALTPLLMLRPKLIFYVYLGIIVYFPNVLGFGVSSNVKYLSLYSAGTGMLLLPLVNIYLYGIFVLSVILYRNRLGRVQQCSTLTWLWALSGFYLAYAFVGVAIDAPLEKILGGHSTINVLNMTLLMATILRVYADEKELSRLTHFLIFCVVTRDLFGVVRFAFWGGDISNVYANVEKIDVTLTFQDINDSVLACVVGFYCAWVLLFKWPLLSLRGRFGYAAIVALTVFTIMFSFRRSAWIGLFLAGGLLVLRQPLRRRIQVGILVGLVATFILTTLLTMRLGQYEQSRQGSLLLYDITGRQGQMTAKEGRFTELAAAFETIQENWLLGVGPWGHFNFGGPRDYMHGGLLQVWLKLGLIGLVLFLLSTLAWVAFYLRKRNSIADEERGLFEAGAGGLLFLLPTLVVGTPIIEFRTMQLIGLCLALPYLAYTVEKAKNATLPLSQPSGYP